MTHDELLAKMNKEVEMAEFESACGDGNDPRVARSLRAVVELHKPVEDNRCEACYREEYFGGRHLEVGKYPCPTIQVIEKELQ